MAESEKRDKVLAHRRWRRRVKVALVQGQEVLPLYREVSSVYDFDKDGKAYLPILNGFRPKAMRK